MKTACMNFLDSGNIPAVSGPFGSDNYVGDHWCCTGTGQTTDDNRCDLNSLAEHSDGIPKPNYCPPKSQKCTSDTLCEKIPQGKFCYNKAWMALDKICDAKYKELVATDGISVADRCGTVTWTDAPSHVRQQIGNFMIGNQFSKGNSYSPLESKLGCEYSDPQADDPGDGSFSVYAYGAGDNEENVCRDDGECNFPVCAKAQTTDDVPPPGENMVCVVDPCTSTGEAGNTYCPALMYSKEFMAKYYPDNKCPCDNLTPKETGAPSGGGGTGGDDDDGLGAVAICAIIVVVIIVFTLIAKCIIFYNKEMAELNWLIRRKNMGF